MNLVLAGSLVVAGSLPACGRGGSAGPESLFDLTLLAAPTSAEVPRNDFYALPYPSDLRLDSDGSPALARYPRPDGLPAHYTDVIDASARGFGATQAAYFRFSAALDPATLPAPADTLVDASSVYLVDVSAGPHLGERVPVRLRYEPAKTDYIGENWLAVQAMPGYPPRQGETYAAVVTDGLRGPTGKSRPAPALARVLHGQPQNDGERRAVTAYAPLVAWLAALPLRADGTKPLDHVSAATVYTTQDGVSRMDALRTAVNATPAPVIGGLVHAGSTSAYDLFTGTYDSPNFQSGEPPYFTSGGQIEDGTDGTPIVVRTESLRIAMTIPKGTLPEAGWPVVLVAHGTGGNYRTFVDDGTAMRFSRVTDRDGTELARFAVVGIDQVLHGPRAPAGTDVNTAFFNFQNLLAARDNPKQGAADDFQLARLVKSLDVASAPTTGQRIAFDASKLYFFGHSQGSLTGSLYLGSDPDIKAAIFSGAGAGLVSTLLVKTLPINIGGLVQTLFRDTLDDFHPFLNILQGYFDESDPANYARRYLLEPPAGFMPKSVYVSLGVGDSYAPDVTIAAFTLATGVLPVSPQVLPIEGLGLDDRAFVDAPQVNNVAFARATGVMCEYQPAVGDDGHFVIFDVPAARAQSTRFFGTHALFGVASLDLP